MAPAPRAEPLHFPQPQLPHELWQGFIKVMCETSLPIPGVLTEGSWVWPDPPTCLHQHPN